MPATALQSAVTQHHCPCQVSLPRFSTLDSPVHPSSSIDRGDSMLLAGARNNARNPAVFHLPPPQLPPLLPLTAPTCLFVPARHCDY
jgi:hypothetical protein